MGINSIRKTLSLAVIAGLLITLIAVFCTAPVSAASKKTVYLVDDIYESNHFYNRNGLIKKIYYDSGDGKYFSYFKYDSKGRVKELRSYELGKKKGKALAGLRFYYTGKGKLKRVDKVEYKNDEVVSTRKCKLKTGKKGRITMLEFRIKNSSSKKKVHLEWTYDSKGLVKKVVFKEDVDSAKHKGKIITETTTAKISRNSKGYITKRKVKTKSKEWSDSWVSKDKPEYMKGKLMYYSHLYHKLGTSEDEDGSSVDEFKYKKKKVNKKYLKKIKAQQKDLICPIYGASPVILLTLWF